MEDISHAHRVSLMYKLITSVRDNDDLSIGFDRDCGRRRDELTNNKNIKVKYHLRIMLKDVFSFVKYKKATYIIGYKFSPTRNKDATVLDEPQGIIDARIEIHHIHLYVPHYTPSIQQQGIKVCYLNKFFVRHQQSCDILRELFLCRN